MARGGFRTGGGGDPLYALRQLGERVQKAKREMLVAAGLVLVRQIKVELSTPGTGRRYKRMRYGISQEIGSRRFLNSRGRYIRASARFRSHVASAPGQPPAVDAGALRGSIDIDITRGGVRVGTNAQTAPWLEYGTKGPEYTGGHIAARPFMRPAVKKVRTAMGEQLKGVLRRAVTRGARGDR